MIDHVVLPVRDFDRARSLFDAALRPLGITAPLSVTAEQSGHGNHVGFGGDGKPFFWIGDGKASAGTVHVAFAAPMRQAVDAVRAAALAAGGTDNDAPGLRPHAHPNDYGAFVLDLDGNDIEAVCHAPA